MEGQKINSDKHRRQNNIDTDYNSYIRKNIATIKPIKLNRSQKTSSETLKLQEPSSIWHKANCLLHLNQKITKNQLRFTVKQDHDNNGTPEQTSTNKN